MVMLKSFISIGLVTSWINRAPTRKDILRRLMSTNATGISRQALSKSLDLVLARPVKVSRHAETRRVSLDTDQPRPLVVMLAWMLAQKKHINKYCEIYLRRGCDVLTVTITPWQLLWPVKGSQVIASEVLDFLDNNALCQPLYLHGFSVGGYFWGEVLVKMMEDMPRYQPIIDRIIGQVWDSAADITEIQVGLPLAVFPKNPILRVALAKYLTYHLKTFDEEATCHYVRSSQMFHTNLVHSPALMLVSNSDPVGSVPSNQRVKESWESMGMKVDMKRWEDSKHVSHFLKYKEEYTSILENFLDKVEKEHKQKSEKNLFEKDNIREKEKLQAKL